MPPERWNEVRANRSLRSDVPLDDLETNLLKGERIKQAFATLRDKMAEVHPDVVVVFGDDQLECFDFNNFPSFAVYVGEEFEGRLSNADANFGRRPANGGNGGGAPGMGPAAEAPKARVQGHPGLGVSILTGLMQHGFDPAFCMDMPKPERGIGHAF